MSSDEEDLQKNAEISKKASDLLRKMHQCVSHITFWSLRNMRTKVRTLGDTQDIRIAYILQKITKDDMASKVYRNDNLRRKHMELLHIYELLSVVGIELFSNLRRNKNTPGFVDEVLGRIDEYDKLREYCNKQLAGISMTYNQKVEQFSDTWGVTREKFNISKKKKTADVSETTLSAAAAPLTAQT